MVEELQRSFFRVLGTRIRNNQSWIAEKAKREELQSSSDSDNAGSRSLSSLADIEA